MIFFTLLLIPTLVALGFLIFGGRKVTLGEFAIQNAIQLAVMGAFFGIISHMNTHDVEVWNGRVTSKTRDIVSCSHSYSCNCYESCSGSGSSRSCSQHCSTCYEHSYDVDWDVHTSNGEEIEIDRVDRQGLREPQRFTAVQVGEPTAVTHSFTNYVKGSPDSLFRKQGLVEQFQNQIPAYPGTVFDYYHLNRLITIGMTVSDTKEWNVSLEELNADLGKKKEVNVIVIVSKNQPEDYFYAVEQAWVGGKKNDFTVMISADDAGKVQWAKVMAWTDNKMAEVTVADSITKIGTLDRPAIIEAIRTGVSENFVRKHMKDFEYLSHNIKPTAGEWIFAMILGLTISIGMGIFFIKADVTNSDYKSRNNRRW